MGRRRVRLVVMAFLLAVVAMLALTSAASACPPGGGYWYKVVPGDTWYGVSRKTGVSVSALMSANPSLVRWNNWLYVCDWMWIPCYPTSCYPQPGGYWYQVQPGDTWYGVAWKTGRSYSTLWNANPAHHHWNNWLYAGHWLWIP